MCRLTICISAVVFLGLTCTDASCAQTYKATLLNQPEFLQAVAQGTTGEQHVGHGSIGGGGIHAILWIGKDGSAIDLHPGGFTESFASAAWAKHQVGYGSGPSTDGVLHALLWSGSPTSVIDLHPAGYSVSRADGISAEGQVGTADSHAMLWQGSPESALNLHPAPFIGGTFARGISGDEQVGGGYLPSGDGPSNPFPFQLHALLWRGSAESYVDLHPTGFDISWASGTADGLQIGIGSGTATGGNQHALLWSGTAASVIDLHPEGMDFSIASGISNEIQVGVAGLDNQQLRAYLWRGTAASALDLHPFLSDVVPDAQMSGASAIAPDGTIVGWAASGTGTFAVLWSPIVPEPSCVQLLFLGFTMISSSTGRRRYVNRVLPTKWTALIAAIVLFASCVARAPASILTFDQFTDPDKTMRIPNDLLANQSYGDNITDFSPAAPVGGQYVNYGAGGGLTPNIKVAYRWYDTLQPTNPNPNNNGPGGVFGWNTQYGGLLYVIYSNPDTLDRKRWLSEVQFTPEPGYSVRINSLDYAGFQTAQPEQTLKILADANSVSPQQLWSAGADGTVSFPATAATLSPAITGAPGQTVSILWGFSDRSGLDNISFSQVAIPEPSMCVIALVLVASQMLMTRRSIRS